MEGRENGARQAQLEQEKKEIKMDAEGGSRFGPADAEQEKKRVKSDSKRGSISGSDVAEQKKNWIKGDSERISSLGPDAAEQEKRWVEIIETKLQELSEVEAPTASFKAKFRIFLVQRGLKLGKLAQHFKPELMHMGLFNKKFEPEIANAKGEKFKLMMVSEFLKIVHDFTDFDWRTVCNRVVDNPKEWQECYNDRDSPHYKSDDTVRCELTLDAIFLASFLTVYVREVHRECRTPADQLKDRYLALGSIVKNADLSFHTLVAKDIFKVENQIPLALIRKALQILYGDQTDEADLMLNELCRSSIKTISLTLPGFTDKHFDKNFVQNKFDFGSKCDHLLACVCQVVRGDGDSVKADSSSSHHFHDGQCLWARVRMCILWVANLVGFLDVEFGDWQLKRTLRKNPNKIEKISLPSMARLREAGIHVRGDARGTFDLVPQFRPGILSGTLYIPTFSIVHRTETLWKNMVAFESETVLPHERGVHDQFIYFLKFMDELVNTQEDLGKLSITDAIHDQPLNFLCPTSDILFNSISVIVGFALEKRETSSDSPNLLGTEKDVAELFNSMTQHYTVDDPQGGRWSVLRNEIDGYFNQRSRKIVLEFLKYNFGKPWFVISLIAAIMLLVMTFLQTVYTMKAYYGD